MQKGRDRGCKKSEGDEGVRGAKRKDQGGGRGAKSLSQQGGAKRKN